LQRGEEGREVPSNSSTENAFSGFASRGPAPHVRVFSRMAPCGRCAEQGDQFQVRLEGLDRSGRQAGYVEDDAVDHDPRAGEEGDLGRA